MLCSEASELYCASWLGRVKLLGCWTKDRTMLVAKRADHVTGAACGWSAVAQYFSYRVMPHVSDLTQGRMLIYRVLYGLYP